MKILVSLAVALSLGACSQVAQFTATDTAQAVAIATAAGDTAGVACFGAFNKLAVADANSSAPGLATKIEVGRGVKQAVQGPCAPLAAEFVTNEVHGGLGVFAGLIP